MGDPRPEATVRQAQATPHSATFLIFLQERLGINPLLLETRYTGGSFHHDSYRAASSVVEWIDVCRELARR